MSNHYKKRKITKRNLVKNQSRRKSKKNNKTLKGGQLVDMDIEEVKQDSDNKEQLQKYYCDFNAMKTDFTKILHKDDNIRSTCIEMSQELMYFLFNVWNPILEIIVDSIPRTEEEFKAFIRNVDETLNESQIVIIKNVIDVVLRVRAEVISTRPFIVGADKVQYHNNLKTYYINFTEKLEQVGITKEIIEDFAKLFYRFYLKGGTAFAFVIQSYKELIKQYIRDEPEYLSEEEYKNLLGDYSDYDFNFVINPNLQETLYNSIIKETTSYIYYSLVSITLRYDIFKDDRQITEFKNKLSENKPPISVDITQQPRNVGFVNKVRLEDLDLTEYISVTDGLDSIPNDPTRNKIGEVYVTYLDFPHPFEKEGLRNTQFVLLRLMLTVKNVGGYNCGTKTDTRTGEVITVQPPNVGGELIDVSIPVYSSYERNVKWDESKKTVKINNIYVYNLTAIIHDLEVVVEENRKLKHEKLEKREKRLNFFYYFACIIPTILQGSTVDIDKACGNVFEQVCPKILNDMTEENKLSITKTLVGIYQTFPHVIHDPSKIDIYLLLKQYFNYHLIQNYTSKYNVKMHELKTPFNKVNKYPHLEYKEALFYKPSYFTLFQINENRQIINTIDMEYLILNYVYSLIDAIKKHADELETSRDEEDRIREILCGYLSEFNNIFISLNDNTLRYETIVGFIEVLKGLKDMLGSGVLTPLGEYNNSLMTFLSKHLMYRFKYVKEKLNKKFVEEYSNILFVVSILLKDMLAQNGIYSRIGLRGGYLFDMYDSVQDNVKDIVLHNKLSVPELQIYTNDIDFQLFVSVPEYMFSSREGAIIDNIYSMLKTVENYLNKEQVSKNRRISLLLTKYSKNVYLIQVIVNDFVSFNETPNKIFIEAIKQNNQVTLEQIQGLNLFRCIESHCYELNVFNINIPISYTPEQRTELLKSIPVPNLKITDLNDFTIANSSVFPWKVITDKLQTTLNETVRQSGANINGRVPEINLSKLYIHSLFEIKKDYDSIVNSGKDVIQKMKYVKRLLGVHGIEEFE
jgi:hypothetical protein